MTSPAKEKDTPVTINGAVKWGGIFCSIASVLIIAVWFVANLKSEVTGNKQEVVAMKTDQTKTDEVQDKQIEKLTVHTESTDKTVSELNRKLDIAVTILERMDAKLQRP